VDYGEQRQGTAYPGFPWRCASQRYPDHMDNNGPATGQGDEARSTYLEVNHEQE
jgi:hypothetical protein